MVDWETIFGNECKNMARLIFTDEAKISSLETKARETMAGDLVEPFKKNEDELSLLRSMAPNTVWFVTDPALMRGFDYNCEFGIALVIDRKLNSRRDYLQALGRC